VRRPSSRPIGFQNVLGLAFDPNTNALLGVDTFAGDLLSIDTATGAGTILAVLASRLGRSPSTGHEHPLSAREPRARQHRSHERRGDPDQTVGLGDIDALAFDSLTNKLFAANGMHAEIGVVDGDRARHGDREHGILRRARAGDPAGDQRAVQDLLRPVAGHEPADPDRQDGGTGTQGRAARDRRRPGLAFDPVSGTLFGSDPAGANLVTIDTATGAATPVGPLGFTDVSGIAFDATTSTLFGVDNGTTS
jgi:hypothetical protein